MIKLIGKTDELLIHFRALKTKTYTYLLPLLGYPAAHILIDKFGGYCLYPDKSVMLNAYIGDIDKPDYNDDGNILLLYQFVGTREFLQFEKGIIDGLHFVDSYDPEKPLVMYVLKCPEDTRKDYDLIVEGKYSKISQKSKDLIVDFHGIRGLGRKSPVFQVLYKLEVAYLEKENKLNEGLPVSSHIKIPRDVEISSIMDMGVEIFKKSGISTTVQGNPNAGENEGSE